MANWHVMQKRKRLMMDTPLQEDMTSEGQSHGGPKNYDTAKGSHGHPHDGPKNMNKGYGSEVPGGPPMYGEEKPGGPPMMSKGPKEIAQKGGKGKRSSVVSADGKTTKHTNSTGGTVTTYNKKK